MIGDHLMRAAGLALLLVLAAAPSRAQDQWSWPDKPVNLQVLPQTWSGERLSPVMKGFTNALGVRCSHCHVGDEGKPLSTYDFASDVNPNKDRAREMYRMLGDINTHLKNITPSGDARVNMWCNTCHRGRPKPNTLSEELGERYRAKGVDAALAHYADLKKEYYGRGAYDFGESSLDDFGDDLLGKHDVQGAVRVLRLNADAFPGSPDAWAHLAAACMKAGDPKMARRYYRKVLAIDTRNDDAREMLKKIENVGGK